MFILFNLLYHAPRIQSDSRPPPSSFFSPPACLFKVFPRLDSEGGLWQLPSLRLFSLIRGSVRLSSPVTLSVFPDPAGHVLCLRLGTYSLLNRRRKISLSQIPIFLMANSQGYEIACVILVFFLRRLSARNRSKFFSRGTIY